jgi:hypothetical protein
VTSISLNGTSISLGGTYTIPTTIPLLSITNGMLAGSIDNTKLLNNSITVGTTNIPLGSTVSTISPTILSTDSIKGSTTTSIIDLWTSTNQATINSRTQIKYGLSNLTTPTASNPSLVLGSLDTGNLDDGVIHLYGSGGAKHVLQGSTNYNLYLDNPSGGNFILNNKYGILNTLYNYGLTSLLNTNIKGVLTIQNNTPITTVSIDGSTGTIICSTISSTTAQSGTSLEGRGGASNLVTPSSAVGSILAGRASYTNGVILINSSLGAINTNGTVIQQFAGNLYLDNTQTTASSINIGTIGSVKPTVNIDKLNIDTNITYNNSKFVNINKMVIGSCAHTVSIGTLSWFVISNTAYATPLQSYITARATGSYVRITVNISLVNWGTGTASNRHVSLARSSTPFVLGNGTTFDVTQAPYGLHHTLAGIQYTSVNFSFIDVLGTTAGVDHYYAVIARSNTFATSGENFGNSAWADITVEELF